MDPDSLDVILADFIEEEYADSPSDSSQQKIRNLIAMLAIEDFLFLGDLHLQPYGASIAGFITRRAKTAKNIAQNQFLPIACPATITILMDLRAHSTLSLSFFSISELRVITHDLHVSHSIF